MAFQDSSKESRQKFEDQLTETLENILDFEGFKGHQVSVQGFKVQ